MTARRRPTRHARALAAGTTVVLGVGLLGLLAGCTADDGSTGSGVDQGYVSGDGSVRQWPAADRSEPVELSGADFAGDAVDVADWRGDVVVLNTWYATCPPCRQEAPDLVDLANDYAAQGVHVLGINGFDDAGAADAFQRTFSVPYPSIADADGRAMAALQGAVPVQAVPTTVVLDREGRVAARVVGLAEGSTLRALVDDALAEDAGTAG